MHIYFIYVPQNLQNYYWSLNVLRIRMEADFNSANHIIFLKHLILSDG